VVFPTSRRITAWWATSAAKDIYESHMRRHGKNLLALAAKAPAFEQLSTRAPVGHIRGRSPGSHPMNPPMQASNGKWTAIQHAPKMARRAGEVLNGREKKNGAR